MVEKERMLERRQKNPKKWRDIHKKSMEKTFKKNPEKKNAWKNDYKLTLGLPQNMRNWL